jgi:hypothetical protein
MNLLGLQQLRVSKAVGLHPFFLFFKGWGERKVIIAEAGLSTAHSWEAAVG